MKVREIAGMVGTVALAAVPLTAISLWANSPPKWYEVGFECQHLDPDDGLLAVWHDSTQAYKRLVLDVNNKPFPEGDVRVLETPPDLSKHDVWMNPPSEHRFLVFTATEEECQRIKKYPQSTAK